MSIRVSTLLCLAYLSAPPDLWSQSSPIVPESVWEALANELSGDIAFDHLRHLTLYHSPNAASEGFRLSAEWVAAKAEEIGLQDVETLSLNKPTRGWTIRGGEARIVSPFELKLGDVRETPLRVAVNSHATDVTAPLVDVGEGTKESDYEGKDEGKDVLGKVVFASGEPGTVHRLSVWEHGAVGVISYGSRRRAYPDQMPWRRISERASETESPSTFAWILTEREGERLREKLERADEPIEVKVSIDAEFGESTRGIVAGWIRGTNPNLSAVVLVAHLQEEKPSANDNRSGCASLLEIGRSLARLIEEGKLPRPRRDIRFWWVDEIRAPYQYFAENPDAAKRMLVAFNQDMVGAKLSLGPRSAILGRTPFSRPSFVNDVAVSVFETVRRGNTAFPFTRDETDEGGFARPIVATLGTREPFWAMAVPAFGNTDHLVFNDGRVGVPAVSLDNWPDPYIHSSDDDLWQVDPTQLERNAFVVAATAYTVASLGEPNIGRLAVLLQGGAQTRLGRDGASALARLVDDSAGSISSRYKDAEMLLSVSTAQEIATINSALVLVSSGGAGERLLKQVRARVDNLGRTLQEDVDAFYEERTGQAPRSEFSPDEKAAAERVPEWTMSLAESLEKMMRRGPRAEVEGLHGLYQTEVRNLVDGKRAVLDIYRMVEQRLFPSASGTTARSSSTTWSRSSKPPRRLGRSVSRVGSQ